MGYSNLLAEDKKLVTYRPRLNEVTGSVTATVLLQQIIFHADNVGNRPFYKFRAPCSHKLYREGDSWTEELGFSPAEFDTARSKIATRVKKGDSKTEALKGETANHLVIYWTDASRVTWYMLNVDLLNKILEKLYADSRNSNYQKREESPNSEKQDSGNTRKLEKEDLPSSEIPPKTSKEDTEKTPEDFPEKPQPGPAPSAQSDGGQKSPVVSEKAVKIHVTREKGKPHVVVPDADEQAILDSIIKQTETHPDQFALGRVTEEAQAKGGNFAAPPPAGGDDGLAAFGLFCLYDKRGKQPPRQGTKEHKRQLERVAEALKAYGYQQAESEIVERAAELLCKRKGEWVNPFYPSFAADFGSALSDAEKSIKQTDTCRARDIEAMEASLAALEERQMARPPPVEDCPLGAAIKGEIELQMTRPMFDAYIRRTSFVCDDGVLTVTAPDETVKGWLANRLADTIRRTAVGATGDAVEVRFEAGGPEEAEG